MDSEYQSDSEPNNADPDDFRPTFKKLTKNQQIYGDFEYAYEPEPTHDTFSKKNAYEQFRAGATIETYSSEVEVDLPISKPKKRTVQQQEEDKPILGKFTLNSFLNSLGDDNGLRQIIEQDDDSSQNLPEGLNQNIIAHLQLVKFGQGQEQQPQGLEKMDLQSYLKMNRPKQVKAEPKYKTQEEKEMAQDFSQNYGVGFKMLEKMGYKVTKGLGKEETGIQRPVEAVMKTAFTMKDEELQTKQKKEDDSEKQEQTKQLSIPQKVFQYRSKDRRINNFLLDIKNTYERLQSQMYNCQAQIDSFLKEEELNDSLRCQSQNQLNDLSKDIQKLQDLQANIYSCEHYPHLGLHYKLDQLYVRQLYDQLLPADLTDLAQYARPRIDRLLKVLTKFYLAKARQILREFEQSTAIESKMHKNMVKNKGKKKKGEVVMDLEEVGEESVVSMGIQDQQKMRQFVEVIISKCILPKVALLLNKSTSIQKVSDLRVIDVLEMVKQYDQRGSIFKEFLTVQVAPKCRAYLETFSLQGLETGLSKMPHQVIFAWLTVVRPEELNLMNFYRRVAGRLWSIENSLLLNLVKPWLKFSSQAEVAFLQKLYLAPRLLYEMEQFTINDPNPALLTGFTQYCELLTFQQREQIMENTLLLQVLAAYREYKSKMEEGDVEKWLLKWRKFADKLSPGFFRQFMGEHGVMVQ